MSRLVRQLMLSRPVLISGAMLLGAREFVALQRTQVRERLR